MFKRLFIIFILSISPTAMAEKATDTQVADFFTSALQKAVTITGYTLTSDSPDIQIVLKPDGWLSEMHGVCLKRATRTAAKCGLMAVFNWDHRVLYVDEQIREIMFLPFWSNYAYALLIHEATHYLQQINGVDLLGASDCSVWQEVEMEAYKVQNTYLSSIELMPVTAMKPQCRRKYF